MINTTKTQAACLTWNLMDADGHLDYDGDLKYMSIVPAAVKIWESYRSGVIRKDSFWVVEDVYITDTYIKNTVLATTYKNSSCIKLNEYNFGRTDFTYGEKRKTIAHEIGHALGLDHTSGKSDIMCRGERDTNRLSNTDKRAYDYCFNNLFDVY